MKKAIAALALVAVVGGGATAYAVAHHPNGHPVTVRTNTNTATNVCVTTNNDVQQIVANRDALGQHKGSTFVHVNYRNNTIAVASSNPEETASFADTLPGVKTVTLASC